MARDQATVQCDDGEWTQLTNGDVSSITFQVLGGAVMIRFTTDETQPSASLDGIIYTYGQGELNKSISDLTNLSGADRVWAKGIGDAASVYVDHA